MRKIVAFAISAGAIVVGIMLYLMSIAYGYIQRAIRLMEMRPESQQDPYFWLLLGLGILLFLVLGGRSYGGSSSSK